MLRIVADSQIPFLRGALEPVARVTYLPGSAIARDHLMDADALIVRTRTRCNPALLEGTGVRYIATTTIGHDHIDHHYCQQQGIAWSNAPGCNAGSVQQYIGSALCRIAMLEGKPFGEYTLGVVGVGHVGGRVERLAQALGMRVLLNDPPRAAREGHPAFVDLSTILRNSHIVTMHVPLHSQGNHATHHMANAEFFNRLHPGAWFINAARGEVACTQALLQALRGKKLAGAVLDVWEHEPDLSHELLDRAFLGTPHIAGYSLDGKANGTAQSVRAISRFFGLGLDSWYPGQIAPPPEPIIRAHRSASPEWQSVCQAILHTYDIADDSQALKANPYAFEQLRDGYPPRREFPAYRVQAPPGANYAMRALNKLGFAMV